MVPEYFQNSTYIQNRSQSPDLWLSVQVTDLARSTVAPFRRAATRRTNSHWTHLCFAPANFTFHANPQPTLKTDYTKIYLLEGLCEVISKFVLESYRPLHSMDLVKTTLTPGSNYYNKQPIFISNRIRTWKPSYLVIETRNPNFFDPRRLAPTVRIDRSAIPTKDLQDFLTVFNQKLLDYKQDLNAQGFNQVYPNYGSV